MPYCSKCGAETFEVDDFCANCGNPLVREKRKTKIDSKIIVQIVMSLFALLVLFLIYKITG